MISFDICELERKEDLSAIMGAENSFTNPDGISVNILQNKAIWKEACESVNDN